MRLIILFILLLIPVQSYAGNVVWTNEFYKVPQSYFTCNRVIPTTLGFFNSMPMWECAVSGVSLLGFFNMPPDIKDIDNTSFTVYTITESISVSSTYAVNLSDVVIIGAKDYKRILTEQVSDNEFASSSLPGSSQSDIGYLLTGEKPKLREVTIPSGNVNFYKAWYDNSTWGSSSTKCTASCSGSQYRRAMFSLSPIMSRNINLYILGVKIEFN